MSMRRPFRWILPILAATGLAGLASAQTPPGPAPSPQTPPSPAAPPSPTITTLPVPTNEMPPEEPAPAAPAPPKETSVSDIPPSSNAIAKPAAPRRTLYTAAVIQVLDKVTAENLRFEAPLHKFVRYKGLIFLVNTCQTTADQPSAAHIEIDSQPPSLPGRPQNPVKLVYRGWMFADTPGPHPFEHPVYDAWLIACKMAAPGA